LDSTKRRKKHTSHKKEIKDHCTSQFKALITRGWVNSFILRDPDEIIQTQSVPQKQLRLQVPRVLLDRTVQNLNKHVQGYVVQLVFNLNKVGISDWKDHKTRKVLVRTTMRGRAMHDMSWNISDRQEYFGDRLYLHCWRITYSLSDDVARFCLDPRAAQEAQCSVRGGFRLEVEQYDSINAEIFLDYIRTVFWPNLAELRTLDEFAEEIGVLLVDNCPSHVAMIWSISSLRHECAS
jgi:hypothetical protein